jgi:HK97 family phage major capsid protein
VEISAEVLKTVAQVLQETYGFATKTELDKAVADVLKRTHERGSRGPAFSMSQMIRGLRALKSDPIVASTAEEDVKYVRALQTSTTPGSYLVPTFQSESIIAALAQRSVLRAAGARVWPMAGMQKLTVPTSLASPTFVWRAQNSVQTPSDPNLGQVSFDLKEQMALVAVPNSLLRASVPAFDEVLAQLFAQGAGQSEDAAFMATSNVSGGPPCIYAFSGVTTVNANNNSANGGTLLYTDLLAVMQKAAENKAVGPFCFIMSPRSWFSRILGMLDTSSRPLAVPTGVSGLGPAIGYNLFGYPVFITANISNTEAVGSGTNQSHIVFANPSYLHIAQDAGGIEIATSVERFFDADQTAVRCVSRIDFSVAPAAGVVVLAGIN